MSGEYCRGCGSQIQTDSPQKPGFLPAEVLNQKGKENLICQRCYRITHYGEAGIIQPDIKQIRQNIAKAVGLSELLVIVVDFSDITGSLPVWADEINQKPYLLVVNKSDLIPSRAKHLEVISYLDTYLKEMNLSRPRDMILTSSLKGAGVEILLNKFKKETSPNAKIALLGVTNVGKSSLIKGILTYEKSPHTPTVSKYPGTTLGLSNWSILKGRNILIDTPGLVPGNRLGDHFCIECASRLLPLSRIEQKLWGIKAHKGLIIGGLVGMESLEEEETVMIAFTSSQFNTHRTDSARMNEMLRGESSLLMYKLCKNCRGKISWCEENIELKPKFDLAIAGLGWVSLRGKTANFKLTVPQGVKWEIRPALIGKKD